MAGRESRSRLLVPSFVIVASAWACGQTTDGGEISMNPPPQTGGSTGPHFFGGNGGGGTSGGGNGGTGGHACPEAEPAQGVDCQPFVGQCTYNVGASACEGRLATCAEGHWQVRPLGSCNPPMLVPCPSALPAEGSICREGFKMYPPQCAYVTTCGGDAVAHCDAATGAWIVEGCDDVGAGGGGAGPDTGLSGGAAGAPEAGGAPS